MLGFDCRTHALCVIFLAYPPCCNFEGQKPCQLGYGCLLIDDLKILPNELLSCVLVWFTVLFFFSFLRARYLAESIAYLHDTNEFRQSQKKIKKQYRFFYEQ